MIDPEVNAFLEHFGVKGMRWGVRKKNDVHSDDKAAQEKKSKQRKIILGSALAVTAIAVGAIFVKKYMNGKISEIPKSSKLVTDFSKSLASEPVALAHSSRGYSRGYVFLRNGGIKNPDKVFDELGFSTSDMGFFKRFGNNQEFIAARFADPHNRKDRSGRLIGHDVILPKSMAANVKDIKDVENVVWPHIKHLFNAYYNSEQGTLGPGF